MRREGSRGEGYGGRGGEGREGWRWRVEGGRRGGGEEGRGGEGRGRRDGGTEGRRGGEGESEDGDGKEKEKGGGGEAMGKHEYEEREENKVVFIICIAPRSSQSARSKKTIIWVLLLSEREKYIYSIQILSYVSQPPTTSII